MDETDAPVVVERWALSVPETAARLGISRAHAYRMVAAGELPSVRLGHRTVVPVDRLRALLGRGGQGPGQGGPAGADTSGASVSVRFGGLSGGDAC